MTRRDQQAQREVKRARLDLERSLSGQVGSYVPPPRETCHHKSWYQTIDDADTIRIRVWTWRRGAIMVDFAMSLEVLDIGDWGTFARVDCKHGTCHLHPPNDINSRVVLASLTTPGDLRSAFEAAFDRLDEIGRMIRDGSAWRSHD